MTSHESTARTAGTPPPKARVNLRTLCAGVAVLELVIAIFVFAMAPLASGASSGGHGRSLTLAGIAAALAAVLALMLAVKVGSDSAEMSTPIWSARVLPLVATGAAFVLAVAGWAPWVSVPLALFAAAPVAVLGLVLPQAVATSRAPGGTPPVGR
jgi:hypothetical protein